MILMRTAVRLAAEALLMLMSVSIALGICSALALVMSGRLTHDIPILGGLFLVLHAVARPLRD